MKTKVNFSNFSVVVAIVYVALEYNLQLVWNNDSSWWSCVEKKWILSLIVSMLSASDSAVSLELRLKAEGTDFDQMERLDYNHWTYKFFFIQVLSIVTKFHRCFF